MDEITFIQLPNPNLSKRRHPPNRLTGTLTHLTSLSSQPPHPLLLPLLTHTTHDIKTDVKGILIGNTVSSKGTSGEEGRSIDKGKVGRGDKGCVLNLGLEVRNCGGGIDRVGGGCSTGGNKDLHSVRFWYNTGCSKPNR